MKWHLLTVGKPALAHARAGADDYLARLRRQTSVEWTAAAEAARWPAKPAGGIDLVLDERGELPTTAQFRQQVDRWELQGRKVVRVLIGGADGHPQPLRDSADHLMALSRLTLQHELALVVFLEQLYRVYTLKRGEPYHR